MSKKIIDKKAAEKFFRLAQDAEEEHDYPKAFEYYTKAIETDSSNSLYYSHRASLREQMQDYLGAIRDYTEVIRLDDEDEAMHVYFQRGYVYSLGGNDKRAKKEFLSIAQIYPNNSEEIYGLQIDYLCRIGEYKEAISICNKLIKLNPAEGYSQRADVYLILKDFKQVLRDFSKAINIEPNNIYHYRDRIPALIAKGDYLEAIQDLTKVIKFGGIGHSKFYRLRGDARYQIKDFAGAIEDYTEAIKQNSKNAHAYKNRGNAYCVANQRKLAIKDFIEAVCLFTRDYDLENSQKALNLVMMHVTEADIKHQEHINRFH